MKLILEIFNSTPTHLFLNRPINSARLWVCLLMFINSELNGDAENDDHPLEILAKFLDAAFRQFLKHLSLNFPATSLP